MIITASINSNAWIQVEHSQKAQRA